MNIEYEDYTDYEAKTVYWYFNNSKIALKFSVVISAVYSEKLTNVVVEVYQQNELQFYNLDGSLNFSRKIPQLAKHQFRGINPNLKSSSGVSFLYLPQQAADNNECVDMLQYEMTLDKDNLLGKKLGIYR